jgi:MATE family multidrug resistance protein
MLAFALVFLLLRHDLPRLFNNDEAVVPLAAAILPIAAAFQLSDGTQVVGGGILRGMGRTRPAAVFNLIAYYVLALPAGHWLAFRAGLGLRGLWWGLFLGLTAVGILVLGYVFLRGPATVPGRLAPARPSAVAEEPDEPRPRRGRSVAADER